MNHEKEEGSSSRELQELYNDAASDLPIDEERRKMTENLLELLRYITGWSNTPPNSILRPEQNQNPFAQTIDPQLQESQAIRRPSTAITPATSKSPTPKLPRTSVSPDSFSFSQVSTLIDKILANGVLTQSEGRNLCQALTRSYEYADVLNRLMAFPASNIASLIEVNSKVAIEVLVYILSHDKERINTIIGILMNMEFSVQCADLIRKVYKVVLGLPIEPLIVYIRHLFQLCQDSSKPYLQIRLVRITAMLVATLLKDKIIETEELYTDINMFCLQFASNHATSSLFQQLKANKDV